MAPTGTKQNESRFFGVSVPRFQTSIKMRRNGLLRSDADRRATLQF
jgi:hypothetical protein